MMRLHLQLIALLFSCFFAEIMRAESLILRQEIHGVQSLDARTYISLEMRGGAYQPANNEKKSRLSVQIPKLFFIVKDIAGNKSWSFPVGEIREHGEWKFKRVDEVVELRLRGESAQLFIDEEFTAIIKESDYLQIERAIKKNAEMPLKLSGAWKNLVELWSQEIK